MSFSASQLKLLANHAAKHSYWDGVEQALWIDFRKVLPKVGVVSIPSWDSMMLSNQPIPIYDELLKPLAWPTSSALADWKKQIPTWVQESCLLFDTHQLRLLHFCGRYPQMLELLDHAPILAWRLVSAQQTEAELVAVLADKRTSQASLVGWQGKAETVKFLRSLRLKMVNSQIAEQVDICLLDDKRLNALQDFPRINSMALSLAARFPEMIGCKLHHALAAMPCRPMQCQSMIAQLEDAYHLAEYLKLDELEIAQIANARYLVEVDKTYQAWLILALKHYQTVALNLTVNPQVLATPDLWAALSQKQQHAWVADLESGLVLYGLLVQEEVVGFLWSNAERKVIRVRREQNRLPTAEQLSQIHLWQAGLV